MYFTALASGAVMRPDFDLGLVGAFAAIGGVAFSLAARIRRAFGHEVDVYRAGADGAFWGGLFGIAAAALSPVLKLESR